MKSEMLSGRSVMVTGGGSGIGRATCLAVARAGGALTILDRHLASAKETAEMVASFDGSARAISGDVTSETDVKRAVDFAIESYGKLDAAFNNAGIGPREVGAKGACLTDIEREQWDSIIAINLTGVWQCMKAQIPCMQSGASIVNNASIAGYIGMAGSAPYVASKHAVVGLTKTAALECAGRGIRVNAVCPGYVHTPMTPASDSLAARIPAGRLGEPAEIAELVTWLCSESASYVTGAAINVDGGFLAGTWA